jgi:hypothetical protein
MLLRKRKIVVGILAAGFLAAPASTTFLAQESTNKPVATSKAKPEDAEGMRRTIKQLRNENELLRGKVLELEKRLEGQSVRDRLVREEQRVENLLAQLVVVGEKEAGLQSRFEEINEQLRPENIDQLQVLGSLRPEEVREATRRRLSSEQNRLRAQIDLLQQSRMRLQASLAVTEMLVQSLRTKLQSVLRP